MQLFEEVRPKTLAGIVGQDAAVRQAQRIIDRGAGGQAVKIAGPSGNGKSTIARIIAESIADPAMVTVMVGADVTADWLRDVGANRQYGWGKGGRAYIIEECHGLNSAARDRLNLILEEVPDHVCWLFTTTAAGEERLFGDDVNGPAFLSRCKSVELTRMGVAEAGAELIHRIALEKGLNGCPNPHKVAMNIMRKNKGNIRGAIQDVEAGAMMSEGD